MVARRAIGVIYRLKTELAIDEYIWIDETSAIAALPAGQIEGLPDTYPFGV